MNNAAITTNVDVEKTFNGFPTDDENSVQLWREVFA